MSTNQETKKIKINMCIPNTGSIDSLTVASFLNFEMPDNAIIGYNFISNCLVHEARDQQVIQSIKDNVDYIFFLDSDMMPPSDTIKKLVAADKDIVSAMCFKRVPPYQPCFYTKARLEKDEIGKHIPVMESALAPEAWETSGLCRVEAVGMACCMIKVDVFKKIGDANWFFPLPRIGEDLTFCMKARSAKAGIYVDLSLNCYHIGKVPFGKEHYQEALKQFYANPENKGKNIFDIYEGR